MPTSPSEPRRPDSFWPRAETWLIVLISIHSYAVGFFLLFLTRWGADFGGWGEVSPLFFARQAGIFHVVVATGYLNEYFRYGGISLLLTAKIMAVLFLVSMMMVAEPAPWTIPLSAIGDGAMGLVAYLVHRKAQQVG
ncbi:MAG: hypothetical protein WBP10_00940 [Thermoanaerobaculia bacterium]